MGWSVVHGLLGRRVLSVLAAGRGRAIVSLLLRLRIGHFFGVEVFFLFKSKGAVVSMGRR